MFWLLLTLCSSIDELILFCSFRFCFFVTTTAVAVVVDEVVVGFVGLVVTGRVVLVMVLGLVLVLVLVLLSEKTIAVSVLPLPLRR